MRLDAEVDHANEVALGLENLPHELTADLAQVVKDRAELVQTAWRSKARRSARRHGKHFPNSITNDLYQADGSIYADIGPDAAMLQGRMAKGFEYGSVHTAPTYDGALTFYEQQGKFVEDIAEHVGHVID